MFNDIDVLYIVNCDVVVFVGVGCVDSVDVVWCEWRMLLSVA